MLGWVLNLGFAGSPVLAANATLAILAAVVAKLGAIPGVQRVYTYRPVATAPGSIPSVMGPSTAVDYWTVRFQSSTATREVGYVVIKQHIIQFEHYYSVGVPTITTPLVDALITAVINAFSLVFSITPYAEVTGPLSVTSWAHEVWLADVFLTYRTEYQLPVQEYLVVQ